MSEPLVVRNSAVNWGLHLAGGLLFVGLVQVIAPGWFLGYLPAALVAVRGLRLATQPCMVLTDEQLEVRDGPLLAGARRIPVHGLDDLRVDGTRLRVVSRPRELVHLDWRSGGRQEDLDRLRDAVLAHRGGEA